MTLVIQLCKSKAKLVFVNCGRFTPIINFYYILLQICCMTRGVLVLLKFLLSMRLFFNVYYNESLLVCLIDLIIKTTVDPPLPLTDITYISCSSQ